jgi:hypothetical protein
MERIEDRRMMPLRMVPEGYADKGRLGDRRTVARRRQ